MDTLDYLVNKYKIDLSQRSPIEIPNADRQTLATWFAELDFNIGAEVGVERGVYSEILCRANPKLSLFLVDPWKAYRGYREHVSQKKLDGFVEITKDKLKDFNVHIVRKFSLDAVKDFENESLDFVYIDANHEFSHVVADICAWVPKVREGGIVAGHDYIRRKNKSYAMHVVPAVVGYTDAYFVKPWFILGRKDIQDGELRDTARSWLWVKT